MISLTLETEWFEIFLCMSAMFSSLKVRLHLKHFQLMADTGILMHNLLISILNQHSVFIQFMLIQ
jgi:hypothetical protein